MSNAHTFRTFSRIEDSMIRASMPRTSASDPVQSATAKRLTAARTWINGHLAAPLTFRLGEAVSRA